MKKQKKKEPDRRDKVKGNISKTYNVKIIYKRLLLD